jgi:hypothetical protein
VLLFPILLIPDICQGGPAIELIIGMEATDFDMRTEESREFIERLFVPGMWASYNVGSLLFDLKVMESFQLWVGYGEKRIYSS